MNTKKLATALLSMAALAFLAMGLFGCITINTTSPSNGTESENSASNTSAGNKELGTENKTGKTTENTPNTSKSSSEKNVPSATLPKDSLKLGSSKTGYISVPSDWKERTTEDFRSEQIDASGITYVVDPTTEYTSAALSHYAFASSIKLETFPCKYTEKAAEYYYNYQGDTSNYSDTKIEKNKFSGHDASIVSCESIDGVKVKHIVFAKNETAPACVAITATGTPSNIDAILSYASSWTES